MGLLDEMREMAAKPTPCTVQTISEQLDPDDRADLLSAVTDPTVPYRAIVGALRARGFKIGGDTVAKHRKGNCACAR
jgi:hypothetical protein